MWFSFLITILFALTVLVVPGYVVLRALNLSVLDGLALSPAISITLYCISGAAFGVAGVATSALFQIAFVASVALGFAAISKLFCVPKHIEEMMSPSAFILCLIAGFVATFCYYILPLDGPDSYVQLFDNAYHANLIRSFVDSSRYSIVQASAFPEQALSPFTNLSFYPAAWHVICAYCVDALNLSVPLAQNAINTVFLSFVWPSSMCLFISSLFGIDSRVVQYSSLFIFAFAAFPWGFLLAGPLYSNFAALCLLPGVATVYKRIVDSLDSFQIRLACVFLLGLLSLVFAQPNVIFTAAVIMVPYTVHVFLKGSGVMFNSWRSRAIASVLFCVSVSLILVLAYSSPFLSGVVNNGWSPYAPEIHQGVIDYIDLGFRNATAQLTLALLALIGLARCARSSKLRWILPAYLYFLLSYLNAASTDHGFFGSSFLSGFWYNDVDRIAANVVLLLIPVVAHGFDAMICFVMRCVQTLRYSATSRIVTTSVAFVFMVANYTPSFILAGRGEIPMSLGQRADRFNELATTAVSLTEDEVAFLYKCKEIAGDDPVLNFPYDGSAFSYMEVGLNTIYRTFFAEEELELLNRHIDEFSSNDLVRDRLDDVGAKYILLLDCYDDEASTMYDDFLEARRDLWTGFLDGKLASEESELEIVLSEGDMRLYRVPEQ